MSLNLPRLHCPQLDALRADRHTGLVVADLFERRFASPSHRIMAKHFTTHSPDETFQLGVALGRKCPGPLVLTLQGPLGAGKTQLIKGLLEGLGGSHQATSPTFALCHYYPGRVPLLHVDAYRLKHPSELPDLGLDEALEDGYAIALEWPDGLIGYLPPVDLEIRILPVPAQPTERLIELQGRSPLGEMVTQI